jgi:hypothetical protein
LEPELGTLHAAASCALETVWCVTWLAQLLGHVRIALDDDARRMLDWGARAAVSHGQCAGALDEAGSNQWHFGPFE